MDYKVSDLRPSKPIGLSTNHFQIVNLRDKIKNIILCCKPFTNNIYRVKKRINKHLTMDYKVSDRRSVKADRSIYKPFPNHQFERENKTSFSVENLLQTIFIGVKKRINKHLTMDCKVSDLRSVKADRCI
jgi:hypothetical protein